MPHSKTYSVLEAKQMMERFCAYQERCYLDVEQKLKKIGMQEEAKNHIMLHLCENNFLNEERFSKLFSVSKNRQNQWGKRKIEQELLKRRISKQNILSALEEIDEAAYQEVLTKIVLKKKNSLQGKSVIKQKESLIRYLFSKGYESERIYKSVGEVF